jgi:hypothetical protein
MDRPREIHSLRELMDFFCHEKHGKSCVISAFYFDKRVITGVHKSWRMTKHACQVHSTRRCKQCVCAFGCLSILLENRTRLPVGYNGMAQGRYVFYNSILAEAFAMNLIEQKMDNNQRSEDNRPKFYINRHMHTIFCPYWLHIPCFMYIN